MIGDAFIYVRVYYFGLISIVKNHLLKVTNFTIHLKVLILFYEAKKQIEKVWMDFSSKEEQFVRKSLASRSLPSPKMLTKDNNTINKKGDSPTRLVIPTTNFTATFSNIGYPRIKCLRAQLSHPHRSKLQGIARNMRYLEYTST